MKKSDLTRRAVRFAKERFSVLSDVRWLESHRNCAEAGFEAGYRAARKDVRRLMRAPREEATVLQRYGAIVGSLWHWLKAIK